MTNQETITLKFKGEEIIVPKAKIKEFGVALSAHPAYSAANVDTHIGFIYSGNFIAVKEFLDWYEDNK